MDMDYLKIDVSQDCYSPAGVHKTLTVGELMDYLRQYDAEMPVIIFHDDADMYCAIDTPYINQETYKGGL